MANTLTTPLTRAIDPNAAFTALNDAMEHLTQATHHQFGIAQREAARDPEGVQYQQSLLRAAITKALPPICTYAGLDPKDPRTLDALHLSVRQIIEWAEQNRLGQAAIAHKIFA